MSINFLNFSIVLLLFFAVGLFKSKSKLNLHVRLSCYLLVCRLAFHFCFSLLAIYLLKKTKSVMLEFPVSVMLIASPDVL